jgi:acyl-CoA synthetase (AMP-forming)/AMP-acid ligase II
MAQLATHPAPHFTAKLSAFDDNKSPFETVSVHQQHTHVDNVAKFDPRTIDALLRKQSQSHPNEPILAYPNEHGEYVEYTYRQLDIFAFRVAQKYAGIIPQRQSSSEKERVVGLLGASNLDYFITVLALSKLGFTVLFLSTRISNIAYQSLLEGTSSCHLLVDSSFTEIAKDLQVKIPSLVVGEIAPSSVFQSALANERNTRLDKNLNPEVEATKISWIIHSSGSTGLPKPIYQTHQAALNK